MVIRACVDVAPAFASPINTELSPDNLHTLAGIGGFWPTPSMHRHTEQKTGRKVLTEGHFICCYFVRPRSQHASATDRFTHE